MTTAGSAHDRVDTAIFAGGCFWCMVPPFSDCDGVLEVVAGYSGGTTPSPTYEEVASGRTDHYESVRVTFDPTRISYRRLLDIFWQQIDPTDDGGQFADRGRHYRTVIFYTSDEQKREAEESREALAESGVFSRPIATRILQATDFYVAEEYHQDYHIKNAAHYRAYKRGSGRETFIDTVWKEQAQRSRQYRRPVEGELRQRLSSLQYHVTQEDGTEPPFRNTYWDNKEQGIYVDIVSGEPLFSSTDKYDSGTGWPSFSRPLVAENIVERADRKLLSPRTEVRSRHGDSHLGHVFPDGPPPDGLRYCLNSAALRFIPAADLEKEGYGAFKHLFSETKRPG